MKTWTWYASVNYGLETLVRDRIKGCGAVDIKVMDSALIFSCSNEINVKCINNLFIILSSYNSKNIMEAAEKLARLAFNLPNPKEFKTIGRTFRVVVMDCGKLRPIPGDIMNRIEKNITRQTKLIANRANPETEIWLNRRNDGKTFFMLRVKKHQSYNEKLKKGELRPDIADIMLFKAKVNSKCVIADLFGGWGAIAAAAESSRCKMIYTGDINSECVKYQKERLKGKKNCIVQKWDACALPLNDNSIDAVVTDPPWGEFEKINTAQLYDGFIKETARILRPGGLLVFLSSAYNDSIKTLAKYKFKYSHTPLKINGKDAFLFWAELK